MSPHCRILLPLLVALLAPGLVAAEEAPRAAYPDNMIVETLDNGLQVVIEERTANPIVRVTAYMRIGAIYEDEYLGCGLSHYMEHIVSGGSTRRKVLDENGTEVWVGRTEEENKRLLKTIGNNSNAKTSLNYTQYFITTKSEMAESAVDLISGYLQHCQFDPVEVKREQGVVQQELLRNLDDPNRERGQLFSSTIFKVHPARVPVIGYRDCIQGVTRDDMLRFYDKHYTPQNCVVSIVGDVDKHQTMELVKRYFGTWKRKPLAPYQIPDEPEQSSMRWVEKEHGSTKTCLVLFGVPTIPLRHPDLYKLDMLSNVLGLGAASRLPRKFEHDPSRKVVATQIGTGSLTPAYGAGRFACSFSVGTVEQARAMVHEVWAEMGKLKTELVSQQEIDRALKVLEKYYHMGRATVDDRSEELASNLAWLNDPLYTDGYLTEIRKVTPEEIREAARTYLVDHKLNVTILTPPAPAATRKSAVREAGKDDVRKVVLDNGLTLLLKRVPDYGMVDLAAAFNGGVIYEDDQNSGLFFLMANTFWRGTKSHPFQQLMQAMDDLGMEFSAESHNNIYNMKLRCLASDQEQAFGIFKDILLEPAIEPQWIDRVKMLLLTRVFPNQSVQPREISQKVLRSTLYKSHPYRRQRFGSAQTVQGFTADQVRALYEKFTRPNNCVIAVYGDIDPDQTEALLRKTLGGWEKGELPASGSVDEPLLTEPITVELTNRQVRTNYRIAWRAISRQDKVDRHALSVMGTIIGATGWLHARLREGSAEYVYSVYGQPYTGDKAGHYFIDTDFSPKDEQEVLAIIDGVVADIRAGKFTDEELETAKKMILCYDALGKANNDAVAMGDALSELYGDGWDSDKKYYAGIKAVTREDVVRIANRIFGGPALRILIRPAGS